MQEFNPHVAQASECSSHPTNSGRYVRGRRPSVWEAQVAEASSRHVGSIVERVGAGCHRRTLTTGQARARVSLP